MDVRPLPKAESQGFVVQADSYQVELFAAIELECDYARAPVDARGPGVLLVVVHLGIPERAVVTGVNTHAAVVAPALAVTNFDSSPFRGNDGRLHFPERIGCEPAGVPDARFHRAAGGAHTHGNVALFIHGRGSHP